MIEYKQMSFAFQSIKVFIYIFIAKSFKHVLLHAFVMVDEKLMIFGAYVKINPEKR